MKFVVQAYQVDQKLFGSSSAGDSQTVYLKTANPKKSIAHKPHTKSEIISESLRESYSLVSSEIQPEDSPRLLASLNKHTV